MSSIIPLTALVLAMLSGCAAPEFVESSSLVRQEQARSKLMVHDFDSAGVFIQSAGFDSLAGSVLKRLYPDRHRDFRVRLARLPEANAFALPTNDVVIHLGLLASMQSVHQLAFVIAHEIAHIEQQHSYASAYLRRQSRIKAQLVDIVSLGSGASFGHYAAQLRRSSRQQEYQADRVAAQVLYKAGYDLREAARFFDLMQERSVLQPVLQSSSTHPEHSRRRNRVLAWQLSAEPQKQAAATQSAESGFTPVLRSLLRLSIEDNIAELDFLSALQQIDTLAALGSSDSLVQCLRGDTFLGIAQTDPGYYVSIIDQRHSKGIEEQEVLPQVYDEGREQVYFYQRALHEYLSVLDSQSAAPGQRQQAATDYTCALRGAGLSSHALNQYSQSARYLEHYLQRQPAAIDVRYIRRLQHQQTMLTSCEGDCQ